MNAEFAYPWVLWCALIVPIVLGLQLMLARRRSGVEVSVPSRVAAAGKSVRLRIRWMSTFLLSLGLVLGIAALARPREAITDSKSQQDAVAIELVVDRSGSMDERSQFGGERIKRIEAVKTVVEEFVVGDGDKLQGRPGDLLGLIVFGTYADTMMPLTQSHDVLVDAIRRIETPKIERERSTAIGDALVLACARLKASEDSMKADLEDSEFEIKSKAIILLTDGDNREGTYSPQQASRLAADWGIKIYIIGIQDNSRGLVFRQSNDIRNKRMASVAEHTGGGYWSVESLDDLAEIYATIDELERTQVQISETTRYEELYHPLAVGSLLMIGCGYLWRFGFNGEVV